MTIAPEVPPRRGYRGLRTRQAKGEWKYALQARWQTYKRRVRPIGDELRDNALTIASFSCGAAAGFIHSVFSGLIVTAILFLAYEFKTSDHE
jgi:hypothetical protein